MAIDQHQHLAGTSDSDSEPLLAEPRDPGKTTAVALADLSQEELTPRIRAVIDALVDEIEEIKARLNESEAQRERLSQLADEDSLVPVANRRAFMRELERVIAFAERYDMSAAVLYFDLNGMKAINDNYGHAAGDAALVHLATVLQDNVRRSDVVGRLGGDEFGVLLAQADDQSLIEKSEALGRAISERPFHWNGREITLSAAYGGYRLRAGDDAESALSKADKAMYDEKRRAGVDNAAKR